MLLVVVFVRKVDCVTMPKNHTVKMLLIFIALINCLTKLNLMVNIILSGNVYSM